MQAIITDLHTINKYDSIKNALLKLNENRSGFLVVLENKTVIGTLTDGDIRRSLIKNLELKSPVKMALNKNFKYLSTNQDFLDAIEVLKDENIDFLPILNQDKTLFNIITKKALHSLLLQDISVGLDYNFLSVKENLIDNEIFSRPWGFYKTTFLNELFQSKIINLKPNASISLQKHLKREEYWVIIHGEGTAILDKSIATVKPGSTLFIPKGCLHRLTNNSDRESLILAEVQLGNYFGEDDIIRFEDCYGRA